MREREISRGRRKHSLLPDRASRNFGSHFQFVRQTLAHHQTPCLGLAVIVLQLLDFLDSFFLFCTSSLYLTSPATSRSIPPRPKSLIPATYSLQHFPVRARAAV